jgi:hypothetical protein
MAIHDGNAGRYAQAYLLTHNSRAILDYNCFEHLRDGGRALGECDSAAIDRGSRL